jgi:peptidoglycan-associated lipoprotein
MRASSKIALVVLALAMAACSRGADPDALFGGGAGGPGGGMSGMDPSMSGFGPGGIAASTLPGTEISDRVLFEVDQSTLTPEATAILNAQAGWLTQNPGMPILIEGHADERGTREYNLALGARRASAVRNYMVSQGIPDARISTVTFGRERPIATCADESCFQQNRRAVTVVTSGAGA